MKQTAITKLKKGQLFWMKSGSEKTILAKKIGSASSRLKSGQGEGGFTMMCKIILTRPYLGNQIIKKLLEAEAYFYHGTLGDEKMYYFKYNDIVETMTQSELDLFLMKI